MAETLKTKANSFVLDPGCNWKPVECSKLSCCTCIPRLTEHNSGSMIFLCAEVD